MKIVVTQGYALTTSTSSNATQNSEPSFNFEEKNTCPFIASVNFLTIESPSPEEDSLPVGLALNF